MNPEQITLVQNSFKLVEPIAEIAAAVGFADSAAFSHAFKRVYGMPPSRARADFTATPVGLSGRKWPEREKDQSCS